MDPEAELIARLQGGDEAALALLYARLGRPVFALAQRMLGSREDAEEVVQDAFVKLYQHASRFDAERGSARAFLYGIARNEALMRLRARRARPHRAELDVHGTHQVLADRPHDQDAELSVAGALDKLEPGEAELLRRSFFEGYSHAELAQEARLPLGTVKSRLRRTLLKLRDLLEGA